MSFKLKNNKEYEFFDVTADLGFVAYGDSIEEAYKNASKAMFNVISNTDYVDCVVSEKINIKSEDLVSLLYDYLSELLFIFETEFLLLSKFNLLISEDDDGYILEGVVCGELVDWDKHERGSEVKAVTYHLMDVKKENNYEVRVILDL